MAEDESKRLPTDQALARGGPVLPIGGGAGGEPLAVRREVEAAKENVPARVAGKEAAVVVGIKQLQKLQEQTVAVLEGLKGTLEDISQVLRSPEATRGMEKQRNAAALLGKGFSGDAVEQARGAVELLPANPDAYLLLALSLASDGQVDGALGAARKGLALFDRRQHPLAIEAGLLHAIATLGHGGEAAERWGVIIEALPVPVLLEHLAQVAQCYPAGAPAGQLDGAVVRRLGRAGEAEAMTGARRVELGAKEIPAVSLFAGLAAAAAGRLMQAHRAMLNIIATRLKEARDPPEVIRFLAECLVPLGEIGTLEAAVAALGRSAVKRLLRLHADAMSLHRGMLKLEQAGATASARDLASLLNHWRRNGDKVRRGRDLLGASLFITSAGLGMLAWVVWGLGAIAGKPAVMNVAGMAVNLIWVGPAVMGVGLVMALVPVMRPAVPLAMPEGRAALTKGELRYLRQAGVKGSVRALLG